MSHTHPRATVPTPARRRLLLGAGAALGGFALAGCASMAGGPSIGRVVVVGGGFGGATAARYLKLWGGNVDVTLVERNAEFVSCPMSNLVLGGHRPQSENTRGYDGLKKAGVKVVQGEVVAVDIPGKTVRLAGGAVLPWDRLVLSPGVDFLWNQVGGLQKAVDDGSVVHAWKAGPQTLALRRQLEALRPGGVVAMTIPRAPYRCPPGPYERACMIASHLKAANPRAKLIVFDANPEILSKKGLFERAFKQHYEGLIEYRPNAELKEVSGRQLKFEFEDLRADVVNVVPPQAAGTIARSAGLVNVNDRWVGVNWLTMESQVAPGVHVLGDATFSAPLMPKSGHMANQHAKVAAAAILNALQGLPPNPEPLVMNTCYSFVTAQQAIHVASVHRYDAADKTFKTVPGSGGVSSELSVAEGRFALGWAENIWADMLAL